MTAKKQTLSLNTVRGRLRRIAERMEKLHHERIDLINRCPHDWVYHPDPSGNNDSSYDCAVCGKSCGRRPE